MADNYHTPHSLGAPLTSAEVNAPLHELDLHLTNVLGVTFNAAEYGVVAGGLAATNRAALQAVFDACHAAGGGRIILPRGTIDYDAMLELPYPVHLGGQGMYQTVLHYTGTATTSMRFKNYATAVQRLGCRFENFGIVNGDGVGGGTTNVIGWDLKGLVASVIINVRVDGFTGATGIGFKLDGSYGGTIGCWWNTLINCHSYYAGTNLLITGVAGNGQANANTVIGGSYRYHSVYGINVDVGDTATIDGVDVTSTQGGVGIRVADSMARLNNIRSEQCATAIRVDTGGNHCQIFAPSVSSSAGPSILINGAAQHVTIASPSILGSPSIGISIQGTVTHVLITHPGFASPTVAIAVGSGTSRVKIVKPSFGSAGTTVTDAGTATASSRSMQGEGLFPLFYVQSNIAANQTSVALPPAGADPSLTAGQFLGRPYQIRGISYRLSAAITAGTMTVKPTIGGTESTTLSIVAVGSTTGNSWQGMGKDTNAGSSTPGVKITTDGSFAPTTTDIIIAVWIEFTDL